MSSEENQRGWYLSCPEVSAAVQTWEAEFVLEVAALELNDIRLNRAVGTAPEAVSLMELDGRRSLCCQSHALLQH